MKIICTKRNPDGSFDEVGMRNRLVLEARSIVAARIKARPFAPCRLEIFGPNFYTKPKEVLFLETTR